MAFWKNSKYTKPRDSYWFDEPSYNAKNAASSWQQDSGYGYGGGYGGYQWKPKYDMSMSLENRVTGLIKTITGKSIKLVQASGWGSDNAYFYYNPSDLEHATDDEVLGRILQQLGKDLFQDTIAIINLKNREPIFGELLDTLEANRSDRQLGEIYLGTKYYASELWQVRKFTDNPISKYSSQQPRQESFEQWLKRNDFTNLATTERTGHIPYNGNEDVYQRAYDKGNYATDEDKRILSQMQVSGAITVNNPAWEFNFNIHAMQNGERDFDFSDDQIAEGFSKALPHIDAYLNEPDFTKALVHYELIKPYYPQPDKTQQQQMQQGMGKTQGLSQQQKQAAAKEFARAQEGDEEEQDGYDRGFLQHFSGEPDNVFRASQEKRSLARHNMYLNEYRGTANTLHSLIRSILQDNAVKRYARPFKRGKLDSKSMYKYLATDNLRIFKKPHVISKKDYLMSIVIDMSGSMGGAKASYATKSTIVLSHVLDQLGFPYEIIAFDDAPYVVKSFDQKVNKAWLPVLEHPEGSTNGSSTVKLLKKHLLSYDGDNKYQKSIFWITDGDNDNNNEVKRVVNELEQHHRTKVFGIGIGGINKQTLLESFNTAIVVNNVAELPRELVNAMKGQFRRG